MNLKAVFFLPEQLPLTAFHDVQKKVYGCDCPRDEVNMQYLLTYLLIYSKIADDNDEPVARLCLYCNAAISDKKTLLFGNIECVNNILVFEKLITEAEQYACKNGYDKLLGPINGNTWGEYRLPLTNGGRQFVTDLPQPLYYAEYLLKNKFEIVQRYYTQQSELVHQNTDEGLQQKFRRQDISIRTINLHDYDNELQKLYPFCANAFSGNIYYSPISADEFTKNLKKLQPLIDPEFVMIADNRERQIVALLLCLPDVYNSKQIIMKTMARKDDPNLKGLMTHLINLFINRAVAAGYTRLLHAFYHEKNRSGLLSEKYNGQPFKSYALFQKKISF